MFHDEESIASQRAKQGIIPGEDLSALSLDDLAERRTVLEAEIARIDEITDKKKAGLNAADAVFKF
ncbi:MULTISPECIES: DUF1192 domain-containing protein [Maricaulis]|jgi:uncharacterized small protein (DUF1192 family)|uniref:DUF1192 domain-containing protein n=1 Tax=Maricaulis maris (strain MCS10) TaxID=394221 RepID=Q0ALI1_MARMM|nr:MULTISPECIES: DUF1192 domain-containing protein [Maricaulis]ABI66862.1 hypothetical protein Mmar10_2576 [Maricaulis maris MCS10]MAC90542.1 DUF1192 domain-containing protein [Maricaulis sp.]